MRFGEYLKICRESLSLTQEEMVADLYIFDTDIFSNLDITTLSRWERGVTSPSHTKQISVIKFFQNRLHLPLPCIPSESEEKIEKYICKSFIEDVFSKNSKLVLEFPSRMISYDDLEIHQLRQSKNIDSILDFHAELDRGFHYRFEEIGHTKMKEWAMHPSNRFFICLYKGQLFGLLFSLSLKRDIFEKIIRFEMDEKDIVVENFARETQKRSNYVLSFFSMNDKAASALFIRYYAHLLAYQKVLEATGTTAIMDEAKKLLEKVELDQCCSREYKQGLIQSSYVKNIFEFVASKPFVKLIFQKEECKEA